MEGSIVRRDKEEDGRKEKIIDGEEIGRNDILGKRIE